MRNRPRITDIYCMLQNIDNKGQHANGFNVVLTIFIEN